LVVLGSSCPTKKKGTHKSQISIHSILNCKLTAASCTGIPPKALLIIKKKIHLWNFQVKESTLDLLSILKPIPRSLRRWLNLGSFMSAFFLVGHEGRYSYLSQSAQLHAAHGASISSPHGWWIAETPVGLHCRRLESYAALRDRLPWPCCLIQPHSVLCLSWTSQCAPKFPTPHS